MSQVIKPGLPKGTRDFNSEVMAGRNYIIHTIKSIYEIYGFLQIETPAFENLETLTGKYGEEGDRLIFKILNSGDFLQKADDQALEQKNSNLLTKSIAKKALRYDLTIPFARFVAQYQNELTFPFKRYQIQPVWRADRPQKGRYQEFYQCDADIVGSTSLLNDMEFISIIQLVFEKLNLPVSIKFNNRKVLKGIASQFGLENKFTEFATIVDKIDKIGWEKVKKELIGIGANTKAFEKVEGLKKETSVNELLQKLSEFLVKNETGAAGIAEMQQIVNYLELNEFNFKNLELDPLLARGLDYYTGTIIEVVVKDSGIGSVCGGGRYDNLTSIFGLDNLSGIGISFGIDRIYDILESRDLFPDFIGTGVEYLFINFGKKEVEYLLPVLKEVRSKGSSAMIYPDSAKLKKQFKYADANNIRWVILAGEEEIKSNTLTVRDMENGEQKSVTHKELLKFI